MTLNSSIIFSSYIDTKLTFAISNNLVEIGINDYADVTMTVNADGISKSTTYRIYADGGNGGITTVISDKPSVSYSISITANYTFFRTDIRGNPITLTGSESNSLNGTITNTGTMVSPTDVALSITNASYTQDSTGQRMVIFDVPYSIINQSSIPLGTNVDLYVQFKRSDGVTPIKTLTLLRTLNTTNGIFHVDIRDNTILVETSLIVEVFMWLRNTTDPIAQPIQKGLTLIVDNPPVEPQTNWVLAEIVLAEFKDNLLSVPVTAEKTTQFPASYDSEPLNLILQIKNSSNIVIDRLERSFDFQFAGLFAEFFEGNYNVPSVQLELFVWDNQNRAYSTVIRQTVTNQITPLECPIGYHEENGICIPDEIIITPPNAPTISSSGYNNQQAQVLISWTSVSNATQYNLEVSSPLFPTFSSLGGDASNWELSNGKYNVVFNLSEYGNYQFRVRAKNSAGYSNYSNVITVTHEVVIPPPDPATQTVIQIQTPNNNNDIRGVLNPTNLQKWISDNDNSILCNYPQFNGLNVPCSLTWFNIGAMVSEPDNFESVISQIAQRYGGSGTPPKSSIMQKALGGLALLTTLSLLGSKR